MKENYGNLDELKILGSQKENSYTIEQLINDNLKVSGGENRKEVTERMEKAFNKILNKNIGKKVAIVSHGASIKFLLMKWCNMDKSHQMKFREKTITVESPGLIKLIFEDEKLKDLIQIV